MIKRFFNKKDRDLKLLIVLIILCIITLVIMLLCQKKEIVAEDLVPDTKDEQVLQHNTQYLQSLMDQASEKSAVVKIPQGNFYFGKQADCCGGEDHYCIKCRDNVTLKGEGMKTILYPVCNFGPEVQGGLDMFFYNEYRESNFENPQFLSKAVFRDFCIDGANTKISNYNTSGKGFMINLFKDCQFESLIVRNTDATGIGVDCPINSTMKFCTADNCGKAGDLSSGGASGIGIGYGYTEDESLLISGCQSYNNDKFGIFFEHQGKWSAEHLKHYPATKHKDFGVFKCYCVHNKYADIGGLSSQGVLYKYCIFDKQYFDEKSSDNVITNEKGDDEAKGY